MSAKRIPSPTAPQGSLLWLIQYAHYTATHENRGGEEKTLVLEHARARAAELSDTLVPQGLIEFVRTCQTPWAVLAARLVPPDVVTQSRRNYRQEKVTRVQRAGLIP